jgi:hypothetical protein
MLSAASSSAIVISTNTTRVSQRGTSADPFTVSYSDCTQSNEFVFTLSDLTAGQTLSVWATESADCTDLKTRNDGLCTRILDPYQLSDTSTTVRIKSADIANTVSNVASCVDSGAVDSPRPVKLYFLINETQDPVTASAIYETKIDLLGPPPPTGVAASTGGADTLALTYTAPTSSQDVVGYYFYCEPAGAAVGTGGTGTGGTGVGGTATASGNHSRGGGGTGGVGGGGTGGTTTTGGGGAGGAVGGAGGSGVGGAAGVGGTGGTTGGGGTGTTTTTTTTAAGGTGGGTSGACTAPHLVAGELPPASVASAGSTQDQTTGYASGLQVGVVYACGVAGYDLVGNVGKLSELACAAPEPIDDFFSLYRKAGGQAGGGYCGYCAARPGPKQGLVAWGLAGGLGLALLGRRRRSSARRRAS